MDDIDKLNELLHFMKGPEPFKKTFAILIRNRKKWCPFLHENGVDPNCYHTNASVQSLLEWIEKYLICCKYLDVNKYSVDAMSDTLIKLRTPEAMHNYDDFQTLLDHLVIHIEFVESELHDKLSRLECQECARLDEALVCFQNYCFYSAVVMAVSALEYRIIKLIKRSDEQLYLRKFSTLPLGQLIKVFDEDEYKGEEFRSIKTLMPPRHKPLVSLLNQYRVFSAHPKDVAVTSQISEAILHLAFAFMTDPETCPYSPEELICSKPGQR